MDNILNNALKKKIKLEKNLEEINNFIEIYKSLDSRTKDVHLAAAKTNFLNTDSSKTISVDKVEKKVDVPIATKSHQRVIQEPKTQKRVRGTSPNEIVPMIEDILIAKGLPMTRSEVLKELLKDDVNVGGGDKSKNIGTIMWRRKDKFISLPGQGYWLKNRPCRKVNYIPEDTIPEGGLI